MTSVPPAVGTIRANGVRLGYREHGDPAAPPVVLLHGSGSSAPTWDRFAARLDAAGHRAVALDLRGHGTSERTPGYALTAVRDDVLRFLDALQLEDAVLVGHSVGGHAALAAALHSPERVGRLVLEDPAAPPPVPEPITPATVLRAALAAPGVFRLRRDYELRAVARLVRQLTRPDPAWWARLADVLPPTLILSGGAGSCIPPARLAAMAAALPGALLTTIPVGHRVHSLAPDTFAAEVFSFLATARNHGAGERI